MVDSSFTIVNAENGFSSLSPISFGKFQNVCDFYKNKHILITGGTGFMGKVLIEKLLWECEGIGNLYILLREKKGINVDNRLKDLLKLPVFDRIKNRNPHTLSKIIPIQGDVGELNLGISQENRKILEDNVSIIFHVASSVRFDDPLKKAILLNVRGTREVVNLARNMKRLKVLAYVSTIYCNSDRKEIDEKVYTPDENWRDMIEIAEYFDDDTLNLLCPKILGRRPNTYTFSKNLAENIVYEYRNEIPILIFRPSIVTFSVSDPIPGWLDNVNGPMGISLGVVTGILHVLYADGKAISDYIPCDFSINALICSAWYRGLQEDMEHLVVNCATGDKKQVSTDYLACWAREMVKVVPFAHMIWYPTFVCTSNRLLYLILFYLTHLLPAFFVDIVLKIKGIEFSLVKLYKKVYVANECLQYFLFNEWLIRTNNYVSLGLVMEKGDKEKFEFDVDKIDELQALFNGFVGMKRFMLKEDMSPPALESAIKHNARMYYLDRTVRSVFGLMILWLSIKYVISLAMI